MTKPRVGLFVIRAWLEPGSSSPLRAQIHRTTDVSQGFEQRLTVAEREVVVAAVQAWMSQMLAGSPTREDDPGGLPGT